MQVRPLLVAGLVFLDDDPVGFGPGILAHSRHLPGNLQARAAAGDGKTIVGNLRLGSPYNCCCLTGYLKFSNRACRVFPNSALFDPNW